MALRELMKSHIKKNALIAQLRNPTQGNERIEKRYNAALSITPPCSGTDKRLQG
jgi:hypothetical protein